MADIDGDVRMYPQQVKIKMAEAADKALAALALTMEGQAKINIQTNDQIDTGFMLNSIYTITKEGDSHGEAAAAAEAQVKGKAKRTMAPAARLPGDASAGVIVGANYAVYQEMKKSFLFKAGEEVARNAGGTVETIFREIVRD